MSGVVWHWVTCAECGGFVYAKLDELRAGTTGAMCCDLAAHPSLFGKLPAPDAKVHPTSDTLKRTVCPTCGHAKRFGTPPASGEEDEANVKKKTKAPKAHGVGSKDASNGKPLATLGEAMKGKRPSEPVERKRYHQPLPVRIAAEEAHAKGAELARVCRERKEFEDEVAEINRQHRERVKYFKERIEELRIEVEQATVTRPIECVDLLLPTNEVQTIRCDTGEVLKVRPARADELQESLLTTAANAHDAKKKGEGKGRKDRTTDPAPPPAVEPPFGELALPEPSTANREVSL